MTSMVVYANQHWNTGEIELAEGQTYRLEVVGQQIWTDWFVGCDADGYESPNPFLKLFEGARRAPSERWFTLMGSIDSDPARVFKIGRRCSYVAPTSGRLSCFANDVGWMYWNNYGSLSLSVSPL